MAAAPRQLRQADDSHAVEDEDGARGGLRSRVRRVMRSNRLVLRVVSVRVACCLLAGCEHRAATIVADRFNGNVCYCHAC